MRRCSNIGPEVDGRVPRSPWNFFSPLFVNLADPLLDRAKRHSLFDFLVLAVCATLASADDWAAILTGFSDK
jgi:hypothetical protein